jgi:hypothetical protein
MLTDHLTDHLAMTGCNIQRFLKKSKKVVNIKSIPTFAPSWEAKKQTSRKTQKKMYVTQN